MPTPIEEDLSGKFLASYRTSTSYVYSSLKRLVEEDNSKQRFYLCLTLTLIGHFFSELIGNREMENMAFEQYIQEHAARSTLLSYKHLHSWLQDQDKDRLTRIVSTIAKRMKC